MTRRFPSNGEQPIAFLGCTTIGMMMMSTHGMKGATGSFCLVIGLVHSVLSK